MNRPTSLILVTLLQTTFHVCADDLKTSFQNPPEETNGRC